MSTKLITERMTFPAGCTIGGTAEAPVIEGVLLCGTTSANKRRYLAKAFEGDRIKLYNGVPVGTYHTDSRTGRKYLEQLGLVQNARHRADGMPLGDIHVNPEKQGAKALLWDARHQPAACGMSHVVHCETRRAADGWEDVTELVKVESVDVIAAGDAATTKSLLESTGGRAVADFSLKQFAERFGPKLGPEKWGALKKLCEDLGAMADAPVMDAPADDMTDASEADLESALTAALAPFIKDAFASGNSDKLCTACRDFVKLHAKHTGKNAGGDIDANPATPESRKYPDRATIVAECAKAKFTPSYEQGAHLERIPDPDTRTVVIESMLAAQKAGAAERPESSGRDRIRTEPGAQAAGTPARVTWD